MFRPFVGQAGADRKFKNCDVEGVWIRNSVGLIEFSPEEGGVCYPPHPDVNWLLKRSVQGDFPLDIQDIRVVGPYRVVCCYARDRPSFGAVDAERLTPVVEVYEPPRQLGRDINQFVLKKISSSIDACVPASASLLVRVSQ
jgi:hypothetical protein